MSRRADHLYIPRGPDQFDPGYGFYDNSCQPPFQRQTVPAPHYDGVAYWYRSDPQETMFEHGKMLYNQNMPIASSPVEPPLNQKHRRTRSGCFTCRQRRVKCDETRPICDRCKKGNRECQFPQPSSSSRRVDSSDPRGVNRRGSTYDGKHEASQALSTIDDEDEGEGSISPASETLPSGDNTPRTHAVEMPDGRRRLNRKGNLPQAKERSPSSIGTTSPPTPADTPDSVLDTPKILASPPMKAPRWHGLSPVMQQYMLYHQEHITRYHYFLKVDPNDFIHNEFIDMALEFEPLLYAVVGFAAYHQNVGKTDGKFKEFWKYYCESIMLLRQWLACHTERNEAAILTILQLAIFEEYLGDWASMASHHKAAYSIFSTLYIDENIMATETSRAIFDWIARGDLSVSIMSGTPTILDRHWFTTALEWHEEEADANSHDLMSHAACVIAKLRLTGFDMATVHASASSNPNAMKAIQSITRRMDDLRCEIQALHETSISHQNSSRSHEGVIATNDAFDPRLPLFQGELWPLNFLWVDWYATEQMHKYQSALFMQAIQARAQSHRKLSHHQSATQSQVLPVELEKLSLIQCKIFEAIESQSRAPPGAVLGCQGSLALASVFLKQTPKHLLWARRKLAKVECMGYVWPPSFRKRMAQLWNDPTVLHWWMSNDKARTALLSEIREVVEERNREIEGRGGDDRDDVREMKAVFEKLDFGKANTRARKDSVWSIMGADEAEDDNVSDEEPDSDGGEDRDNHFGDAEQYKETSQEHNQQPPSRQNRDSGIGSVMFPPKHNQPMLEYSNRMSGIWEGPHNAGQKLS